MSWIIAEGTIFHDNTISKIKEKIIINTHFNTKKIRTLFKNLTSLNLIELIKLRKQYKSLNYSTSEVDFHLHKLYSFPLYLSIMTVLSSIIMLNIKRNAPIVFHIILGVMLSVLIYYFYYLSSLLGINGKIPLTVSIYVPLLILTLIITIGLVKVNEK
jgi:lipopolysaccharide export system permease protein